MIVERETSTVVTSPFDVVMQNDGNTPHSPQGVRGMSEDLNEIRMQVMWNRLISVVEEQAMTLLRTAFSTSVREAGDLSAGVFDPHGRMLAQAVTGTPGHVNTMAEAVLHFMAEIPRDEMFPGRHLRNQRSVEGHWASPRHHHGLSLFSGRRTGGLLRLHRARGRCRRSRFRRRRQVGLRRRHPDSDHEVRGARRGQAAS